MKKSLIIIAAIIMIAGLTNRVMAQTSSTKPNDANAQILGAIVLTAVQDLEFGGIVADAASPGTVIIDNADGRTSGGAVTLVSGTIIPKSGAYTVTGTGDATYSILIPTASFDILNTTTVAPANKMAVTDMTCSKGALTLGYVNSVFAHAGTDTFKIGGKLNVLAGQVPGLYTGTFDVTVAY